MIAKLYIDEDVSVLLAKVLRKRGIDAVAAHEVGMKEKEDADHLRYATQQQRVLLTFNVVDFMKIVKKIPNHTGIICSVQIPLDNYSMFADAIIDKLRLITDWSRLVVWVKLK